MSRRLFRSTKLSQGGLAEFDPADALFNHAGTLIVKSFLEVQEHEWDWLMAVNVKSMYLVTQAVLPQMISNGAGSIVCTSSISAQYATQAEEIVFICALPDIGHLAYSLMRLNASPKFSSVQFEGFQMCQTMVDVLLQRHFQGLCTHVDDSGLALREHLNNAFSRFAADQLTPREQLIVSMILRGHSRLSISLHLGIAEGTVKNHRKHLYCKLGISSQSELFHLSVNFVLCHTSSVSLGCAGKAIKFHEASVSQWKSKGVISSYAVNSGARKNAWTQIHAFFFAVPMESCQSKHTGWQRAHSSGRRRG